MPRECPCRSATNQSALDVSNANGKQRRKGMRDQEAISRGVARELQGMEKLDHGVLLYVFWNGARVDQPPRPPSEMP